MRTDLRDRVIAHVCLYPGLSAFEIARALGLGWPEGGGGGRVRRLLRLLEEEGMVRSVTGRGPTGCRSIRWWME